MLKVTSPPRMFAAISLLMIIVMVVGTGLIQGLIFGLESIAFLGLGGGAWILRAVGAAPGHDEGGEEAQSDPEGAGLNGVVHVHTLTSKLSNPKPVECTRSGAE